MNTIIFNAGWHCSGDHPRRVKDEEFSDNVLIDMDGRRMHYRVGWYDFKDRKWHIYDRNYDTSKNREGLAVSKHLKWSYLPLAEYDGKPDSYFK